MVYRELRRVVVLREPVRELVVRDAVERAAGFFAVPPLFAVLFGAVAFVAPFFDAVARDAAPPFVAAVFAAAGFAAAVFDAAVRFGAAVFGAAVFVATGFDAVLDAPAFGFAVVFAAVERAADVRVPAFAVDVFAAGFAAARVVVFDAVLRAEAVLRPDDFAAGFAAAFVVERAAGFADAVLAGVDFAVDFFAGVALAAADRVDAPRDAAAFAAGFFAVVFLAVADEPLRADDARVLVVRPAPALFAPAELFAVVRLLGADFLAPAEDERELDDREDERVAAAIVRVTSAASPGVASAISPPSVINDPPEFELRQR